MPSLKLLHLCLELWCSSRDAAIYNGNGNIVLLHGAHFSFVEILQRASAIAYGLFFHKHCSRLQCCDY